MSTLPTAQAETEEPEKKLQLLLAGHSSGAVHWHQAAPSMATTPNAVTDIAANDKRSSAATRGDISL